MIDGVKIFEHELNQIKDENIRSWTEDVIKIIPEDFYHSPSSRSGRFHPPDEFCEKGSVIHAKRTFYTMKIICDSYLLEMSSLDISVCLSAALIHDCCVTSGRYHAEEVRKLVVANYGENFANEYPEILDCIDAHMGRWGTTYPSSRNAHLVHLADNIAAKVHDIMNAGNVDKLLEIPTYDTK
jgi:hypothetical protein